jgi:ABC-type Fe3+-siderophore transport system permease subunit
MSDIAQPPSPTGPAVMALALATLAGAAVLALIMEYPAFQDAAWDSMAGLVLMHSTLPRLATALIAGAALGLSGGLLQQVLRNPLASPTTLGVSAGANLSLVLATLLIPDLLGLGRDLVALAGSTVVAMIVLFLGARRGFSPFSLVLSGLVISLWCGALAAILTLLNDRYLVSLFIWGAGSLSQQSWDIPLSLLYRFAAVAACTALILKPLSILELGEESAAALGVKVARLRLLAVAAAVALAAFVTSAVGVIGFIGLVAPLVARLAGARRTSAILVWASIIGGVLLLFVDASLQILAGQFSEFLPTGAITAVFGSPLLLLLLPRLKVRHRILAPSQLPPRRLASTGAMTLLIGGVLAAAILAGLFLGRAVDGTWTIASGATAGDLLPLRAPKVLATLASGAMLAVAGAILQRLTGNEMASPEVLGISAGATFGVAAAIFLLPSPQLAGQLGAASFGAFAVLGIILVTSLRSGLAPERVLIAGIALGAMVDAVVGVFSSLGDPRALLLMRWMSGSTYAVDADTACVVAVAAAVLVTLALLSRRWLDLLPLGPVHARALGVPPTLSRLVLFLLAGLMSAAATLSVGPLSFIGLMGPHLAREFGLARALPHMAGAAVLGGGLMVLADWIGRAAFFPYQIPAGLVSALVGAPFLMLMLRRKA